MKNAFIFLAVMLAVVSVASVSHAQINPIINPSFENTYLNSNSSNVAFNWTSVLYQDLGNNGWNNELIFVNLTASIDGNKSLEMKDDPPFGDSGHPSIIQNISIPENQENVTFTFYTYTKNAYDTARANENTASFVFQLAPDNYCRFDLYQDYFIPEECTAGWLFSNKNVSGKVGWEKMNITIPIIDAGTYGTTQIITIWQDLPASDFYYYILYDNFSISYPVPDTIQPNISIQLPLNQSYTYITSIALNYTAFDNIALDKCWYKLDSGANTTLSNCGNTSLSVNVGSHNISVYANDTSGNLGSASRSFIINASIIPPAPPSNNGLSSGMGSGLLAVYMLIPLLGLVFVAVFVIKKGFDDPHAIITLAVIVIVAILVMVALVKLMTG